MAGISGKPQTTAEKLVKAREEQQQHLLGNTRPPATVSTKHLAYRPDSILDQNARQKAPSMITNQVSELDTVVEAEEPVPDA
jgi:hypothetical protein